MASIETHTIETIVTGIDEKNIRQKLELHYTRIEHMIKINEYTEVKIKTNIRAASPKEAKIYTSFEGK